MSENKKKEVTLVWTTTLKKVSYNYINRDSFRTLDFKPTTVVQWLFFFIEVYLRGGGVRSEVRTNYQGPKKKLIPFNFQKLGFLVQTLFFLSKRKVAYKK